MKKALTIIINLLIIFALTVGFMLLIDKAIEKEDAVSTYIKAGIVEEVEVEEGIVTVVDNEGRSWSYYGTDIQEGTSVVLTMQGTHSTTDKIIAVEVVN